jgi:uncharacterized protein (TIGR03503 family)
MDAPQNTHWRGGDGYALITVKNPAIGEWLIIGEVDPDNRVMVVTDLKLAVQPLPNGVSPGQRLSVQAELLKEGERITQQGFLELVEMRLAQTLPDGEQRQKLVVDDGSGVDLAGFDGLFSAALANTEAEGQHELLLTVDGGSFQRSFRHRFAVQWPADLRVEALGGAPPNYAISLSPRSDVIAAEGLQLEAELLAPGGEILPLALAEELGEWRGETGELSLVGDYRLRLRLRGQQPNGEPVSLRLPERMLAGRALPSPAADVAAEPELVVEEPGATNWGLIGGAVLGVNLLLGGLGWLYWRRSRRQVDSLIEDDDADAAVDTAVEFDAADAARDDPAEMAAALDAESPVDTVEEAEVPVRTEDEFDARGALDEVPGEVLAQAGMEEVDTLAEQPDDEPEPELIVADDEAEEPPLSAEEPDEVMDAIGASEPADDDDAAPAMLLDDVEVDWPEGIEVDGLDDALSDAESEAAAATTASEDDAVAAARSAEDLLTDLDDAALFDETDDADEDPRQQAQGGS